MYHEIDRPEEQLDERGELPRPAMTITLNNASFDNQTFKIYSEGFGRGKRHVEADMVPVTLRGDDYDFDGKGLVIRWNERDRRLQLLEIAHGEMLTIWHPNSMMRKDQQQATTQPTVVLEGPLPAMLAAKGRAAAATGDAVKSAPAAAGAAAAAAVGPRRGGRVLRCRNQRSRRTRIHRFIGRFFMTAFGSCRGRNWM